MTYITQKVLFYLRLQISSISTVISKKKTKLVAFNGEFTNKAQGVLKSLFCCDKFRSIPLTRVTNFVAPPNSSDQFWSIPPNSSDKKWYTNLK